VTTTLAQIMADGKDLCDLVGNPIVGDITWRRWINQGQERLYRLLVAKIPARFHKSVSFTLTGVGGNTQALASDFRVLRPDGVTKDPTNRRSAAPFAGTPSASVTRRGLAVVGLRRRAGVRHPGQQHRRRARPSCAGNYAYYYVHGSRCVGHRRQR
jgi:hypothetical protein